MLWPPPKRGEDVALACGCKGTVKVALPVVYLYSVCISVPSETCGRSHRIGSRRLVRLETMVAAVEPLQAMRS